MSLLAGAAFLAEHEGCSPRWLCSGTAPTKLELEFLPGAWGFLMFELQALEGNQSRGK